MSRSLGDMKWTLAPLTAFFHSFGGWGWRMLFRGVFVPASVCIYAMVYHGVPKKQYWIAYLLLYIFILLSNTLPLTFFGDGLNDNWFNWVWVWIAGALKGAALFPLVLLPAMDDEARKKMKPWLFGILICSVSLGLTITLSNLTGFPPHKIVEIATGLAVGGVAAYLI